MTWLGPVDWQPQHQYCTMHIMIWLFGTIWMYNWRFEFSHSFLSYNINFKTSFQVQKHRTCCSLLPGFFLSSLESVASDEQNNAMQKHATIISHLILTAVQCHYNMQINSKLVSKFPNNISLYQAYLLTYLLTQLLETVQLPVPQKHCGRHTEWIWVSLIVQVINI